jgi:hypothetical protein
MLGRPTAEYISSNLPDIPSCASSTLVLMARSGCFAGARCSGSSTPCYSLEINRERSAACAGGFTYLDSFGSLFCDVCVERAVDQELAELPLQQRIL